MRSALACLVAFMLAACSPTAPQTSAPTQVETDQATVNESGPTIVMLGDSLTAGYQLPPAAALPAAVQRALADKGVVVRMVNAGVSGDTTADALARYQFSVADLHPDLLVVALGANDFLNGLPPETARTNLAAILDRARADKLPAALMGIVVPRPAGEPDPREAAFAAIYPDLAKTYGAPLLPDMLDAVQGRPELLQADGVHPTAQGVEAMAEEVAAFLAPLVADLGPPG